MNRMFLKSPDNLIPFPKHLYFKLAQGNHLEEMNGKGLCDFIQLNQISLYKKHLLRLAFQIDFIQCLLLFKQPIILMPLDQLHTKAKCFLIFFKFTSSGQALPPVLKSEKVNCKSEKSQEEKKALGRTTFCLMLCPSTG